MFSLILKRNLFYSKKTYFTLSYNFLRISSSSFCSNISIINDYIHSNQYNEALDYYNDHKNTLVLNENIYSDLIKGLTNKGENEKVLNLFNSMKKHSTIKPTTDIYNNIITIYYKTKQPSAILSLLTNEIKDILYTNENFINSPIHKIISQSLCDVPLSECIEFLRKQPNFRLDYSSCDKLLNTIALENDKFRHVKRIYNNHKDLFNRLFRFITYTNIINRSIKHKDYDFIYNIFKDIKKEKAINQIVLSILLNCFLRLKQYDTVKEILDFKEEIDFKLDQNNLTSFVIAYIDTNHVDKAIKLINSAREDKNYPCKPTILEYNAILKYYTQKKYFKDGVKYFEILHELYTNNVIKFNLITYEQGISCYAHNNQMDKAFEVIKRLNEDKIEEYSGTLTNYIINGIVHAYIKQDNITKAKEFIIKYCVSNNQFPDPNICTLFLAHCSRHDASWLFNQIKKNQSKVNVFHYSAMIETHSSSFTEALRIFNDAKKNPNITLDISSYNTIIKACRNNNNIKQAILFFKEMLSKKIKPNTETYSQLIYCSNSNDVLFAFIYFDKMILEKLIPSINVCNHLMKISGEAERYDLIDEVQGIIKKYELEPNETTNSILDKYKLLINRTF